MQLVRMRVGRQKEASRVGEPVAACWQATESTPVEVTDVIKLRTKTFRYDKRKSTAYLANTILPEQRRADFDQAVIAQPAYAGGPPV